MDTLIIALSLATLMVLLLVAAITIFYNSRQTKALLTVSSVVKDFYMMQVKDRREQGLKEIKITQPAAWVEKQSGYKPSTIHRLLEKPKAISFNCEGGVRVVVSPLDSGDLRRELRGIESKKTIAGNIVEPLLGRNNRAVQVIERNILKDGDWFDEEAKQVGEMYRVNWGSPNRLYFYIVP